MRLLSSLGLLLLIWRPVGAQTLPPAQSPPAPAVQAEPGRTTPSSLYVKVRLDGALKVSALKPGDLVEGRLAQDVYSGDRELFPAGSPVRMTVDRLARRRREPNDHWPWVVQFFTPRHEKYPTFQSATVSRPDGTEVPLQVSLIFINRETEILTDAKTKKTPHAAANSATQTEEASAALTTITGSQNAGSKYGESKHAKGKNEDKNDARNPIATLEATYPYTDETLAPLSQSSPDTNPPVPVTLAAGTRASIILLGGVSASRSRAGDFFQARLVEPVRLDSKVVLPEGTLLQGRVVKSTAPRLLSRAGSLLLTFTGLTLPGGTAIPASASVTAAELDQRSHTRIDPEGKLQGDRPGKAWMLLNTGVTAGIAKVADDGTQLLVQALVETATDASTAGTARIVGACASSLFMLTRHGRDVVLPRFTQMNIVFDRPVSLFPPPSGSQLASRAP